MILLRLISWPYLRKHLLRSVLTTAGIVLGVALLVGMQTANQSVLSAFNRTVEKIAGKAQLQVTSGDTGFAEDVLEKVQALPEVQAAAPVIETSVDTGRKGQGRLLILGVDMTGDRSLRDYDFENADDDVIDDPLVFLAQPDSVIITRDFAGRNGLSTGSRITLDTMLGRKDFTVRGILKATGMAQAFGGNLGIMDIYAAQAVFGRGRHFDRIDIGLKDGVPVAAGERALKSALGPGFTVEPPSGRGRQFESLLSVYNIAVDVSSLFALFIGMFLIYNSFAIAVTERRSEIGILRALGATRGQIRSLFLGESAVAGLIGSAAGIWMGLAVARTLAIMTGQLMEGMLGVNQNVQDASADPRVLLLALVLGVGTSMLAALLPARSAARVEPVQALQKGKYQVMSAGESRLRRNVALVAVGLSLGCAAASRWRPAFFAGYALMILAALLLTPFFSLELARLLRRPMKWLRPVEGSLAADSLIQAPRRTSATVAALMMSLALVIGQAGVARGSLESLEEWITNTLNPDLFISTSETLAARGTHFPAAMREDLQTVPGIDEIQSVRTTRVDYRGQPIMIVAVEMDQVGRRVKRHVIAGDSNTMYQVAGQGKGVVIAENLAGLTGLHLGDSFELNAPAGLLRLPVVGIIRDLGNQLGTVFIDRQVFIHYYQDDSIDVFRVYVKPGSSIADVRRAIIEGPGSRRRLFVMLNHELREYIEKITGQWFGLTYIQVAVAVLVAVLGIVNTLTVSITDRRRELGVLRAVGGLRRQIRGTIWMEAVAIGLIGLVLGIAVGAVHLYYSLEVIQKDLTGMPFSYSFPAGMMAALFPVILGVAFAASVLPAETAVRSSLVEALEYE